MRILITGAGGFVGQNLSEYLSGRYEIIPARRSDLDLQDETSVSHFFETRNPDIVLHCAATGGSRKTGYDTGNSNIVEQNLRMFMNIVRALKPNMRLIHFGTGAEYDRQHWCHKMAEEYFDQHVPKDSYGYAKYLISKYIEQQREHDIVCLRIFGLFGKHEDYRVKFISNAIVKNLLQMPITINQNVIFDYLYINDFCSMVEYFINNTSKYRHYNVTPSQSIDLLTVAHIINEISDYQSPIQILNEGMNREYSGLNTRIINEMSDFTFTSYKDAIRHLYAYYQSVLDTLDLQTVREDPHLQACLIRKA